MVASWTKKCTRPGAIRQFRSGETFDLVVAVLMLGSMTIAVNVSDVAEAAHAARKEERGAPLCVEGFELSPTAFTKHEPDESR